MDRLVIREDITRRLTDSVEAASNLSGGIIIINVLGDEEQDILFSQNYACEDCGVSIEELTPRMFSFNNPFGACPDCFGLGYKMEFDEELMIPDKSLSLSEGAIQVMGWQSCTDPSSFTYGILKALSEEYSFDLNTPCEELPEKIREILLHGTGGREIQVHYKGQRGEGVYGVAFEGLVKNCERRIPGDRFRYHEAGV